MSSVPVKAFFSCSFAADDKSINEFFKAICEGLGFECVNVSTADAAVPPDVARRLIGEASALIAVVVKRDRMMNSDKFKMPESVSNEIGMAYGQEKKILMFAENCVEIGGMQGNFGTYLTFDRTQLYSGAFIRSAVESINRLRHSLYGDHDLMVSQHPTEYFAIKAAHSYALEDFGNGLEWRHSMRRRIRFTKPMQRPLKISRWNDSAFGKSSAGLAPVEVTFEVNPSSRPFVPTMNIIESSAFHFDGDVTFTPNPVENDEIEYTVSYRGAHLMPVYSDEVSGAKPVKIGINSFAAFDGVIPITPIKVLKLEFRFAKGSVGAVQPEFFVGSYSRDIDYLVESEIGRAKVEREDFGTTIVLSATVSSALLRHVYGVAWDPPARPVPSTQDPAVVAT